MKIHNYNTELAELLDCPFCGGRPIAYLVGNEHSEKRAITIKCKICLVKREVGSMHQPTEWLEEKSIALWNARFPNLEKEKTANEVDNKLRELLADAIARAEEAIIATLEVTLPNCSGCTYYKDEGTHQSMAKQHFREFYLKNLKNGS